jgi:glycerophosphoryl diester phosphodiesterase
VSVPTAVQAHRGSPDPAAGVLENTLESFARARALGADGVELDVRLTADGGLAIHHDPVIDGVGAIHELATADLPDQVPLLADALATCIGMVVNIEVKNLPTEPAFDPSDRCARDVVDQVEEAGMHDSVVISSFWAGALTAVRAAGSSIGTGLLVISAFDLDTAIAGAVDLGCAAVHLPLALVTPEAVAEAHGSGLGVAAWTISDESDLAIVLGAGVDTIVTDDVALARRAVDGK